MMLKGLVICFICFVMVAEGMGKKGKKGKKKMMFPDCTAEVSQDFGGLVPAYNARDWGDFVSFYDKNAIYIMQNVETLFGKMAIKKYFKDLNPPPPNIKAYFVDVKCIGKRAATGFCVFQANTNPGYFGKALVVFVKNKMNKWVIYREMDDVGLNSMDSAEFDDVWKRPEHPLDELDS